MRTSRVAIESRCPKCHSAATGASDLTGNAVPAPDDLSVCAYCAAVLAFNHDMTVRLARPEDMQALPLTALLKLSLYAGFVKANLRKDGHDPH